MSLAMKIWCPDDEPVPEGLTNLTTAPPNWFREDPEYAAELYGLERGAPKGSVEYRVHVLDTQGQLHVFQVKVGLQLEANVRKAP